MTGYPFGNRDLFKQPEMYFFANCAASDFLSTWGASRLDHLNRLQARNATRTGGGAAPAAGRLPRDCFTLRSRLDQVGKRCAAGELKGAAELLDPFVMKFEVFRRLFDRYDLTCRRVPDASEASPSDYIAFGSTLAAMAQAGELKYLSTLLKLVDALLSLDDSRLDAEAGRQLADLVGRERALVMVLTERGHASAC